MAKMITVQKGTKDILPTEIDSWHFIEETAKKVFSNAGYKEIRTPIFEATDNRTNVSVVSRSKGGINRIETR